MSAIKSVAIAGATGYVGLPLSETLLKDGNFKVHLLVRPASVRFNFPVLSHDTRMYSTNGGVGHL